ncbi:MAG TPA: hypothetical protein VF057_08035 [Thermoanaerobaculia bacterium]
MTLLRALIVVLAAVVAGACADRADAQRRRIVGPRNLIDSPRPVHLTAIPAEAQIVAHRDGFVIAMGAAGGGQTQITFDEPRVWEHVALSFDRRFIVGNEQLPNPTGEPGGFSRLWLYDIERQTVARLLPDFVTAGNGGVDWDRNGFIYFTAKERDVFSDPRTPDEFRANAGANDIYRVRYDGSVLQRLLTTPAAGEADVSLSEDGSLIAYVSQPLDADVNRTEIRVMGSDGSNPRLVYAAGVVGIASAHDPETSPDNMHVIFSIVNSSVPPNFPNNPAANTAHDIWQIGIDGTGLRRLTRPGPISIAPDWKGNTILYLDISEADRYAGISLIRPDDIEQPPQRIAPGVNIAKWIP